MMNVNKYTKGYFMPPTVDMSRKRICGQSSYMV